MVRISLADGEAKARARDKEYFLEAYLVVIYGVYAVECVGR